MRPLASDLILSKNTLRSDGAWFIFIELEYDTGVYERFAANQNEEIIWNGYTWRPIPINIGIFSEVKGEIPKLKLDVCNIGREMQAIMEAYDGVVDSIVKLYSINENNLNITTNVPGITFYNKSCNADNRWVYFVLSVFPEVKRIADPIEKIMKNFCRYNYPHSRDIRCPYTGSTYLTCGRTLADCIIRNGTDSNMFGGFVTIGRNRIYI